MTQHLNLRATESLIPIVPRSVVRLALRLAMSLTMSLTMSVSAEEAAETPARLQGDAEAVARVELMLERLGGVEVWARTRTLHVSYDGWRIEPNEPIVEESWRDLTEPSEYTVFEGRTFKFERAFTPESGWVARDNQPRAMTPERHAGTLAFWPRDFYTMIHRFAVADPTIRLRFEAPRKVVVEEIGAEDESWWVIDSTGQPMIWGTTEDGEVLEYVYLPVRDFGNISFPAGGAALDGLWRFTYRDVDVSIDPIPVSLTQPE